MRTVVLHARSPAWRAAALRAAELIKGPDFRPLKAEGRTLAGFIDVPGAGRAFLKRVESPSWRRGIAERARGSRAARALKGAAMLKAAGLAHPEPIAAVEAYHAGALRYCYLISEPLDRAESLSRFALGPRGIRGRDVRRLRCISHAVAGQVRRLHESGLYTRDLQETNVMVEGDNLTGYRVYFIDLEDFRRPGGKRPVSWERRMLNLVHLDRSIGRFLCRAARLDFLYAYLGGRPARGDSRRIVAEILAMKSQIDRRKARGGAKKS
ncbi:MAG TPA: lipopolysaccharide kinase InaA family protein [Candidatus Binataceae bacterium]|nr:lipopolysaccharide kinase InaA family protein [Candidatus Binataceae bacterium]